MNHWTTTHRCDAELNAMQREAADRRVKRLPKGLDAQGRHPEALHGTEGCADTGDERMPEGGFIAVMLVVGCVAVALIGAWLQWGGA